MDGSCGQNAVLHGRRFGQKWLVLAAIRFAVGIVQVPYFVAVARDKSPYFVDAPTGQKSSSATYPQPLPWVLSEPYFVDAPPYIIPSQPYIVPTGPYIVAKTTLQAMESIAVREPKTFIKLRKPNKTPAGHFSFLYFEEGDVTARAWR